jgi:putative N6-adenine-specific DNA methylase
VNELDCFAVSAPGLEPLCAAELQELGVPAGAVPGGVEWRGGLRELGRVNLHCRTATRVLVRVGEFRARTFHELERRAPKLPWSRFLPPGAAVELRVTTRKSKLYHQGAVAERVQRVLADGGWHVARSTRDDEEDAAAGAQLIVIRFLRDVCTVSIDASGARLQQRGYRQALAKAPLRETIAAALLRAAGWRGDVPLLDPLCGSGTIPIEAALLARRIPPGLANPQHEPRAFAFQRWPVYQPRVFDDVVAEARSAILLATPVEIRGSDRDAGAITAARANASRAGVVDDIVFERAPLSAAQPLGERGLLLSNPPYGVRVGDRRELHALYAALGRLVRERFGGWDVALLTADPALAAATGLQQQERLATRNGGVAVSLLVERSAR